jgi:aminopeptidase N
MPLRRLFLALLFVPGLLQAQAPATYTRADTLRGSVTAPERTWWDVTHYDLKVNVRPADSTIRGSNGISFRALRAGRVMQVDLMTPLAIDSVVHQGRKAALRRDGNAYFVTLPRQVAAGQVGAIEVFYGGRPQVANRPPWEGGFSWKTDSLGRPWIVTTDQGIGASIWWPNKDIQADEPDSMRVSITVPTGLTNVSNGRLRRTTRNADGTTTWEWGVVNPINNYAIAVSAGHYAHFSDTYVGEGGTLTLDYWPIDYNLLAARAQFPQTLTMLACFERWFGPYPWYEDGFKLIEVPYNGMEHQSAVTYGNRYRNGYQGRDASGTGLGMQWDFIIVHEAAHEWWGNNLTTQDLADMWVHESFANYSEGIYTECLFGKERGADYIVGTRRGIRNERPVVPGAYGVNAQGSGDMYPKGGNMLHTIRQIIGDDEKWRGILRGLNIDFRHQVVTGAQVQRYISERSGVDLSKVFEQYLTDIRIPVFETRVRGDSVDYRWAEVVRGFDMPVRVGFGDGSSRVIRPRESWQTLVAPTGQGGTTTVDRNYYVVSRSAP